MFWFLSLTVNAKNQLNPHSEGAASWYWGQLFQKGAKLMFFIFFGRKDSGEAPYSTWDGWMLIFVGMINTCLPFRPAQHNSRVKIKLEVKKKIKLQEHNYSLRGLEVLTNFFLHQSSQHYFDFFSVYSVVFLFGCVFSWWMNAALFAFHLPKLSCISMLY